MTDPKLTQPLGIFLGILIAVMVVLSGTSLIKSVVARFAFQPTPSPTPTSVPTVTPTSTLTPTPSPAPTNTPYPAPALVSPDERISFPKGQDVKLVWEWERDLEENEFFEVRVRMKGEQKFNQMDLTKVSYQFVPASELIQAGTYEWQVAIVSLSGEEKGSSQIRSFQVR